MLKFSNWSPRARVAIVAAICLGLAAPALAGTFYSWQTEDGVYSYTDDAKRIPAKYKKEAERRPMGELTRYKRYTEVSSEKAKPYVERIHERQSAYREMTAVAPAGAVSRPSWSR